MPSVEENEAAWGQVGPWARAGDDWSDQFGGTGRLWERVLEPRIGHLLYGTVVEIAPGYGRITARLQPRAANLVAVDLNQLCVDACAERFAGCDNLTVAKNDGRSLPMIPDGSVDMVVSWDALVHVDMNVMRSYFTEIDRVLKPSGAAFVHHSNVGSYLDPIGRALGGRVRQRVNARTNHNWRGPDVSARRVRAHARELGMRASVTERVTWHSKLLNDCFSLLSRSGGEVTTRNYRFFARPEAPPATLAAYRAVRN
jgi:SAM-dependent methyltransferase